MRVYATSRYYNFSVVILVLLLPEAAATEGLVSYWSFDGNQGCSLDDVNGLNNGTLMPNCSSNSPNWTTGINGSALGFDGVDDYVLVNNTSSIKINNSFTIEAWIKPYNLSGGFENQDVVLAHLGPYRSSGGYEILLTGDAFPYFMYRSTDLDDNLIYWDTPLTENLVYQIVATYWSNGSSQVVKLYVNGSLATTSVFQNEPISYQNTPSGLYIGTNRDGVGPGAGYDREFYGIIDDVRIYNRTLNASEILENYQANSPPVVLINEFLSHPGTGELEWVEVYNNESFDVNISGWKLDDVDGGGSTPHTIPNGTVIRSRGFLVFYSNTTGIDLDDISDSVRLLNPIDSVVDSYSYSITLERISYGRTIEGGNSWTTYTNPTPGYINNPYQITLAAGWNLISIPLII